MTNVYKYNGNIIRNNGAIGIHQNCCCEQGGSCCEYLLTENYTVSLNGTNIGNFQITGQGPAIFDANVSVQFDCTQTFDCFNNDLGQKLVCNFSILSSFPPRTYLGSLPAVQPSIDNPNGGWPCDQQKSMNGLTFNMEYCLGGAVADTGTLTVTVN